MELTYMVRGTDGQAYGPVTLPQLSAWIQEGRIPAESEAMRSDMDRWAPAIQFEELKNLFNQLVSAPAAAPVTQQRSPEVAPEVRGRGAWFYWIAGLSLINLIAAFSGGSWRFIFGLGITQIFDGAATQFGTQGKTIVLGLDLCVAAVFVLFGVFATKGRTWAFLVGTILFALDGLIFLLVQDWISILLHVYVLFRLFQGFQASRKA